MFLKTNFLNNYYIKSLDQDQKNVIFYLASNNLSDFTGIFEVRIKNIAEDLSLSIETVNDAIAKFTNDNLCYFDSESNIIIFNKSEFLSFRDNLNSKTEIKLKNKFSALTVKTQEIISEKFADLKEVFETKKLTSYTIEILHLLNKIKAAFDENDTLSIHQLNLIKNQCESLINQLVTPQKQLNCTIYNNILNNKDIYIENKLSKKNTLSKEKKTTEKQEEKNTPQTKKVGRPKKQKSIYEITDSHGKSLFKPSRKYKSKVNAADVDYKKVENMFMAYTTNWSIDGKIAMESVIQDYYRLRASQNWVMSRTLEQDIQLWYERNLSIKSYRLYAQKEQVIDNIEDKFKEAENQNEVKNGNNSNLYSAYNLGNSSRDNGSFGFGGSEKQYQRMAKNTQRTEEKENELDKSDMFILTSIKAKMEEYGYKHHAMQNILKSFKNSNLKYYNYLEQYGYSAIE